MSEINIGGDVSGQVGLGGQVDQIQQVETGRPHAGDVTILFWASNPVDTDRLRLSEEVRTIDERLRLAEGGGHFELEQQWALRVRDLSDGLLRFRPDVVHFSGHGNPTGEVALEDDEGNARKVPVDALARLFGSLGAGGPLRCVVFNACYSQRQATAVAEHVDCVVGTSRAIGDEAAIAFAAGFYRALGAGESVRTAFDLGTTEIALEDLGEEDTPQLLTKPGVDAAEVRFFERPG